MATLNVSLTVESQVGREIIFSGYVFRPDYSPVVNRRVYIQSRDKDKWKILKIVKTDSDGRFEGKALLPSSGDQRIRAILPRGRY